MKFTGWNHWNKLYVVLGDERFRYHTHEIVGAFFPAEQVFYVSTEDVDWKKDAVLQIDVAEEAEDISFTIGIMAEGRKLFEEVFRVSDRPLFSDGKEAPLLNRGRKALKAELYAIFEEGTGRKLPWGSMTGIRPAKIVNTLSNLGMTQDEILEELTGRYSITLPKAELAMEVAKTQKAMLAEAKPNGISLYIGIPFCPTRCLYCSFTSNPIGKYAKVVDTYVDTVIAEMEQTKALMTDKDYVIESIYVGGGTPTSLDAAQLDRLLSAIVRIWNPTDELREFCVEAGRPDSITPEKLQAIRKNGVMRISVNPQTLHDTTLKLIGRRHTVEQFQTAFAMARLHGFDNINVDMIAGLPGETYDMFFKTLEGVLALQPENVTVHTMSVKRASDLKKYSGDYLLTDGGEVERMIATANEKMHEAGYAPFYMYRQKNMLGNLENVSYTKPGYQSYYNVHIMEEDQTILAFGAGAVSKFVKGDQIDRAFNVKSVEDYLTRLPEMIERKQNLLIESIADMR